MIQDLQERISEYQSYVNSIILERMDNRSCNIETHIQSPFERDVYFSHEAERTIPYIRFFMRIAPKEISEDLSEAIDGMKENLLDPEEKQRINQINMQLCAYQTYLSLAINYAFGLISKTTPSNQNREIAFQELREIISIPLSPDNIEESIEKIQNITERYLVDKNN